MINNILLIQRIILLHHLYPAAASQFQPLSVRMLSVPERRLRLGIDCISRNDPEH